nr:POTRA domain-containing protein [Trabulsiella odontotermitis]
MPGRNPPDTGHQCRLRLVYQPRIYPSRAFLTEKDLSSGVLHLTVLEGRLQQIRLEGVPQRMLSMTFPGLKGKILKLRNIEQGIE